MLIKKAGTMHKGRAAMAAPAMGRARGKGGEDMRRHTWSDGGLSSLVNSSSGPEAGAGGAPGGEPNIPRHRYVGFSINLHQFPYVAKNALHMLQSDCFPRMLTNVGLVIEGREEVELTGWMTGLKPEEKLKRAF